MVIQFQHKKQAIKLSQNMTELRKLTNDLQPETEIAIMLTQLIELMEKREWNKKKKHKLKR